MGKRKSHVKISFTITDGKAPHHSSNQQNRTHLAREQQRAEARRIEQERAEAKRIAEEEKAKRKAAEEKARYSMHEKALALYPDFENGTLNKLTPLNEQQSHTPPQRREDGATLPYLLLMSDNINDFLQLVQKMGYKIHLPHLGEHNLLKQLSKRSDAIAILEKINPLSSEEYEFLANEALAQFDLASSPCDDILIWLLRKNQLPQKIINTLNQRTATAIHDHFELYRHLFSKNGMFIKQATAVRTLFLTQLLARRAHLPEEIDQTLTTCYVEEYAYNNNKKIHVDLLFSDLMSTSQKTAADTFEHIKKICQKNASWHITLSEEFWQLLLLDHEPAFVQKFADLVKDRLDINNKNRLIKKTLRTMRTPQESAIILEPWLSKEIVNHENYANLVDIAVKTHTTHFEFARKVLSLSDNIIEPQTSRLSLLRTLFQASTPSAKTLQSWYYKKKCYDIDDTEKKEPYLDTATSSSSQIPAESETLTPISQKILLAFAKISFEKIMCADRAMQLAKELQHTWLQLHFLESYIEIMFEWAKISIIHHEIGPDVNPHHLKIKQFMSEPAIPAQNTLQTIRSSLSILSLFAPPEATMYQSLTDGKKANKIKNTNEIAEQYRKIEEKFQPIFQA